MLLSDYEIRRLCDPNRVEWAKPPEGSISISPERIEGPHQIMIEPFSEAISGGGVISYGLSHAGYDLRLGPEILLFKNSSMQTVDPKAFGDEHYRKRMFDEWIYSFDYVDFPELMEAPPLMRVHRWNLNGLDVTQLNSDNGYVIPPNSYILGRSFEYLRIPRHLKGRCVGKSTMARCGILVNTTPLEPGWEGHLTIEIGNITPCPAKMFVGEGICQMELELLSALPEVDYSEKWGKYQGQVGVTPAKVV